MHMGATYQANQLVFIYETGVNRNSSSRRYGWALCGDRARHRDFFVRGTKFVAVSIVIFIILIIVQRYSVLPALALDGILHADIQEGAYTADSFYHFISSLFILMKPYPGPQFGLGMDNGSIHKSGELAQMCHERYV